MTGKIIYCFGNTVVSADSLALILAEELKIPGVKFIPCFSPMVLMEDQAREIWIMDVAKGIKQVTLIEDLALLKNSKLTTLHDFDLQFFLQLLQGLGKLKKVKIIAIPLGLEKQEAKRQIRALLGRAGKRGEV